MDISSGVDPTVTYIGAGISVLKPILLNNDIDIKGNFIKQKAIRTQSLKFIQENDDIRPYTSFFDSFCVLSRYENLDELVGDSFKFFTEYLEMKPEEIMLRINSGDLDLIKATDCINENVKREFDSREEKYYKHKYGLDDKGIYGRNLNFAFLNPKTNEYEDVGNIIVIESETKKYGAELALGPQAIIMKKFGIDTSIEASYISDVIELDSPGKFKYAEALEVVSSLNREGILNKTHSTRFPITQYKKYLKAVLYWKEKLQLTKSQVMKDMEKFLNLEYNEEFEFANKDEHVKKHEIEFEREY